MALLFVFLFLSPSAGKVVQNYHKGHPNWHLYLHLMAATNTSNICSNSIGEYLAQMLFLCMQCMLQNFWRFDFPPCRADSRALAAQAVPGSPQQQAHSRMAQALQTIPITQIVNGWLLLRMPSKWPSHSVSLTQRKDLIGSQCGSAIQHHVYSPAWSIHTVVGPFLQPSQCKLDGSLWRLHLIKTLLATVLLWDGRQAAPRLRRHLHLLPQ